MQHQLYTHKQSKITYCQENHSIAFTWSLILSSKFAGVVFAGIHKDVQDINKWQMSVYNLTVDQFKTVQRIMEQDGAATVSS